MVGVTIVNGTEVPEDGQARWTEVVNESEPSVSAHLKPPPVTSLVESHSPANGFEQV